MDRGMFVARARRFRLVLVGSTECILIAKLKKRREIVRGASSPVAGWEMTLRHNPAPEQTWRFSERKLGGCATVHVTLPFLRAGSFHQSRQRRC